MIAQYGLPDEVVKLSNVIWQNIVWQDTRKELSLLTFHHKTLLLTRAAEVLKVEKSSTENCSYQEILESLGGNDRVTARRYSGVRIEKGWTTLTEEEAEVAWRAYAQEKVIQSDKKRLVGMVASVGNQNPMVAKAKIVMDPSNLKDFPEGSVLVASMTSPDYVILMRKASAVVTDTGGTTSHAAIVSREIGIPCIVGTKFATQLIKDNDNVEINTSSGVIKILSSMASD